MGQVIADASVSLDGSSAEDRRTRVDGRGALVCGRRLLDFTGRWDGEPSTQSSEGHG